MLALYGITGLSEDPQLTGGLTNQSINGFNALHILSAHTCTPFDEDRDGLNLGEGAAFLLLEKEEDIVLLIHEFEVELLSLLGYWSADRIFSSREAEDIIENILERKLKTLQILPLLT